jgi:hypothetical protein
MPLFNNDDLDLIEQKGLTPEEVANQIDIFKKGNQYVRLESAATLNKGILKLSSEEQQTLKQKYDLAVDNLKVAKFTPASGMATRMFKFLYFFQKEFDPNKESLNAYLNKKKTHKLREFIAGIEIFPFFKEIDDELQKKEIRKTPLNKYRIAFINLVLERFGGIPKGLVPFHNYQGEVVTAFEEQIHESLHYIKSRQSIKQHFTIPPENATMIKEFMEPIVSKISKQHNVAIEIEYSHQHSKTDTLAVDENNNPVRNDQDQLVFRNGGHGSLLHNLNELDEDIVFIKNIDNVSKKDWHEKRSLHKKILAGKLLSVQEECFEWLRKIDDKSANRKELEIFIKEELNLSHLLESSDQQFFEACKKALHRPIRVCGMVKNEGEPGGGPFWVNKKGINFLQIVESAQVDIKNKKQKNIFKSGSHFNPVDLVCGLKDYTGQKFDLTQFSDPNAYFISNKSMRGTPVKALEHPGLWNGSMSLWTTIFVEVPIFTFTPVKSSNELLRPGHQVY